MTSDVEQVELEGRPWTAGTPSMGNFNRKKGGSYSKRLMRGGCVKINMYVEFWRTACLMIRRALFSKDQACGIFGNSDAHI